MLGAAAGGLTYGALLWRFDTLLDRRRGASTLSF